MERYNILIKKSCQITPQLFNLYSHHTDLLTHYCTVLLCNTVDVWDQRDACLIFKTFYILEWIKGFTTTEERESEEVATETWRSKELNWTYIKQMCRILYFTLLWRKAYDCTVCCTLMLVHILQFPRHKDTQVIVSQKLSMQTLVFCTPATWSDKSSLHHLSITVSKSFLHHHLFTY